MNKREVIVVNNETAHWDSLVGLVCDEAGELSVVERTWETFDPEKAAQAAGVILSGSSAVPVMSLEGRYRYERQVALIQRVDVPILGICLGGELVMFAHGSTLVRHKEKISGPHIITTTGKDLLLNGVPPQFYGHVARRWACEHTPEILEVLAESVFGAEIVRHRDKPIYGVHFHPEADPKVGRVLIGNFLRYTTRP